MNMNIKVKHKVMTKSTAVKGVVLACFLLITQMQAQAQEATTANPLLIPPDLIFGQSKKIQSEEWRIGSRLERVTVRRKNGPTEIYQNQRQDSIWFSEENELGETRNVRQWRLGGW